MIFTQDYNFGESFNSFLGGFSVFLIGIAMVFFALVLLILLIKIVTICVSKIEKKEANPVSKNESPINIQEVVSTPVASVVKETTDEFELVAVITAAIAASLGTTTDKLMVRSLRKVNRRTR